MESLDQYSKTAARELTQMMTERLPKEIRDMIWEWYWLEPDEDTHRSPIVRAAEFHDQQLDPLWLRHCPDKASCRCFTCEDLPSALVADVVGRQNVREAATSYLRDHTVIWCSTFDGFRQQLDLDLFHTGITLADTCGEVHMKVEIEFDDHIAIRKGNYVTKPLLERKMRQLELLFSLFL